MRIRSTRPHFWRSERIASVSWDARLVLKGLESFVDDNGVGKDDIALIVGDLFQRDMIREPSRTVARVSEAISELSQAGLLWRYTVDSTNLLYVSFWEETQRIDKAQDGRFPRPDGTTNYKDSIIRESSKTPREDSRTFAPGVVEEGSRGVGQRELVAQPENAPTPVTPPSPSDAAQKRGQRLPADWQPSVKTKDWAESKFGHLNLGLELEKFTNHWTAEGGQKARKCDWDAAFRNWLHNAQSPRGTNGNHGPPIATSDLRAAQTQALKNKPSENRLGIES